MTLSLEIGNPDMPAVLLFHGMVGGSSPSEATWANPGSWGAHYNHSSLPAETRRSLGTWLPNSLTQAPVPGTVALDQGVKTSDLPPLVAGANWLTTLRSRRFTIGFFDAPGTLARNLDESLRMFDEFVERTRTDPAFEGTPPPIVLMGHSRGGLAIRGVLKARRSRPEMVGRVKAVVTLGSPHHGSEVADRMHSLALAIEAGDALAPVLAPFVPPVIRPLMPAIRSAIAPLLARLTGPSARELRPGSPELTGLAEGEQPLPGVRYITVGGTSPTFSQLFCWRYDANLPTTTGVPVSVSLSEITEFSPLLDRLGLLSPTCRSGLGDGLVTDASARLPASFPSTHLSLARNHLELLFDGTVRTLVLNRLQGLTRPRPLILLPPSARVVAGGTLPFSLTHVLPVRWSLRGPGFLSHTGVYSAPAEVRRGETATVTASVDDGTQRSATATVELFPAPPPTDPSSSDRPVCADRGPQITQPDFRLKEKQKPLIR